MNLLAIETSCDETAAALIAETGDAARPWVIDRRSVAYPNISASGTKARTTCVRWPSPKPRVSIPSIWPRRLLRSPITSPMKSSGVVTSTAIIGSMSTGPARRAASLKAIEPASLTAFSF